MQKLSDESVDFCGLGGVRKWWVNTISNQLNVW